MYDERIIKDYDKLKNDKEKVIERLKIHKEYASLENGTVVVNKVDLETVLQLLEQKENIINVAKDLLEKYIDNGTSCNNGDLQLVLDILEE